MIALSYQDLGDMIVSSFNYKSSGVDVQAGDDLVHWLKTSHQGGPHSDRIVSGVGGFASLFRIDFPEMKKPCLITCTDGVGTKVLLASQYQEYASVAQDLVAMCVNDLVTVGGRPLLFLDYYASSHLDLEAAKSFLSGVRKACDESGCALIGGETAEMPGVYHNRDFDCAGFAVGVVDLDKAWGREKVQEGDCLVAIESHGFHSNGYSLLRKVFQEDLDQWKDLLLRPTHLYASLCESLKNAGIHAAAHITGGGVQNIPRILPDHLCAHIESWEWPEEFVEVQKRSQMSRKEMLDTLNCGIGFVFIAPQESVEAIHGEARKKNFKSFSIGHVERREKGMPPLKGDIE